MHEGVVYCNTLPTSRNFENICDLYRWDCKPMKLRSSKALVLRSSITLSSNRPKMKVQTFNPFPTKPWFLCTYSPSLLKTLQKKDKLLITSNFSFSHSVFYQFKEMSSIFIKFEIVVCKLSVWKSLKFVVGERLKVTNYVYQILHL